MNVVHKASDRHDQALIAQRAKPGLAESDIGEDEVADIIRRGRVPRLLDRFAQLQPRRVFHIARGVRGGMRLKQFANFKDVADVLH